MLIVGELGFGAGYVKTAEIALLHLQRGLALLLQRENFGKTLHLMAFEANMGVNRIYVFGSNYG